MKPKVWYDQKFHHWRVLRSLNMGAIMFEKWDNAIKYALLGEDWLYEQGWPGPMRHDR